VRRRREGREEKVICAVAVASAACESGYGIGLGY